MKIPLIWLKDYVNIRKSPREVVDSFTALGLMLDKPVQNDVLDLEHRMDRSDWLSVVGCARDLAAMEGLTLKYPELNTTAGKQPAKDQLINIKVECPELVKRFNTRVFRGITVKKSPEWLSQRLESYGIPSINNIVDITNFVMVELGQPMHAQDLSKLDKPEIVIRRAKKGEEITTLLGAKLTLNTNNFVLTQNDKPTVLGGIVGTAATSVDEKTKDIVLDAGNYDHVCVRKGSREHKVLNETVLRYDKLLHPKLAEVALERATKLILDLAGGEYYQNIDYYPKIEPLKKMRLRYSRIEQIGGTKISESRVEMTLTSLGYLILNKTQEYIEVEVPYFRTDVEVEDDIVSDILRINNYKNIPSDVLSSAPPKEITSDLYKFENRVREILVNLGINEHITNPLTLPDQTDSKQIKLENSFSSERSALRTSLKPGLEAFASTYKKHKISDINLFEIGRVYNRNGPSGDYSSFIETRQISIFADSLELSPVEISKKIKSLLSAVLKFLQIDGVTYKDLGSSSKVLVNDQEVGLLEYNYIVLDSLSLMKISKFPNKSVVNTIVPNYRTEDVSFIIDGSKKLGGVYYTIRNFNPDIINVEVVEEFVDQKIGPDKKSVLIRITYIKDFTNYKDNLLKMLEAKYQVIIRS